MRKFSALPQFWGGVADYGSHNTGQDRTGVCVCVCVCVCVWSTAGVLYVCCVACYTCKQQHPIPNPIQSS